MSGNVFEWCWDWYDAYEDAAQTNPVGAPSGAHRVLRGGNWFDLAVYARSAYRSGGGPNARGSYLGFRVLRPAQ
jgi:formylglycine-generating enzyme required for sulfatase activity